MHGSGTLVMVDGRGCFLTAHHVVFGKGKRKGLLAFERLCIWTSRQGQQPLLPRELFTGVPIASPHMKAGEPDLGALLLPQNVTAALSTYQKAFYNLDRRSTPDLEKEAAKPGALIVLAGAPAEYIESTPNGRVGTLLLGYGRTVTIKRRHGFTFLSLRVRYDPPANPPKTFGGMSGGGVWVVPTAPDEHGAPRVNASALLVGVAFREIARQGKVTSVRCHGPSDIYDRARAEISKAIRTQPLWTGPVLT
jgi:hypothetical protein